MSKKSKLTIVDEFPEDQKILAYRNKPSVEIFKHSQEVGFSDFSYSWEEVIAIGKKLEEFIEKDLVDVT